MTQSIDGLWRTLYRRSEFFLANVLQSQLVFLYETALKHDLITPTSTQAAELSALVDSADFSRVCKGLYSVRLDSKLSARPIGFTSIAFNLDQDGSLLKGMAAGEAALLARRFREIPELGRSLLQFRNKNAHNVKKINDHGNALLHASTVLRLFEIAKFAESEEEEKQKFRNLCYGNIRSIMNIQFDSEGLGNISIDYDSEKLHEKSPKSPTTPTTNSGIDGKITARNLNPEYHWNKLERQLDEVDSKQGRLLPEIQSLKADFEGVKDFIETALALLSDDFMTTNQSVEKLESLVSKIANNETTIQPTISRNVSEDEIATHQMMGEEEDVIEEEIEPSGIPLQDLVKEAGRQPPVEEEVIELLTREQAYQALLLLRNAIRSLEWDGRRLDNWENILQRPLIDDLLKGKVRTLEDWKGRAEFKRKYNSQEHIMNLQLNKFGSEIEKILESLE